MPFHSFAFSLLRLFSPSPFLITVYIRFFCHPLETRYITQERLSQIQMSSAFGRHRQRLGEARKKHELYQAEAEREYPPEMASALASNSPPPEDAVHATKAFRQEPAEALRSIESRISDIDKQMESLRREKISLRADTTPHRIRLKACDTVLSPIRRVPLDILREITLYALPKHPAPYRGSVPLSVSHVCSAWRSAALSSPRLWTTLFLELWEGRRDLGIYEELLGEWFKRAKGLPLSVFMHFDLDSDDCAEHLAGYRSVLRSFAPFAPRVRHLGIGAPYVSTIFALFLDMDPDWDLRSLERLDLFSPSADFCNEEFGQEGFELGAVEPVVIFNQAPLLHKLAIKKTLISDSDVSNVVPWSRLTNVHIEEGLTVDSWIQVMVLSPLMQVGGFYIRDFFEVDFLQEPVREHLHLENLSLKILFDFPHPVDLIKLFNLPKLSTLTLVGEDKMQSEELPSLRDLPHFSLLRSLSLQTLLYPVEYLIKILQQVTKLEMLEIECDSETYPPLLEALTYSPTCTILSRLSTLKLFNLNLLDTDSVYDMVKSRCINAPSKSQPLKCLSIKLIGASCVKVVAAGQELKDKLKLCVEGGLFLDIAGPRVRSKPLMGINSQIRAFDNWYPDSYGYGY
ncbi:hypothetical protein GALMADRAFT_243203 [Galerina marginata CBS 339.88]|uniref:Uncharacterized protein n=1 Tax=Galerina marginata (strain CBS 339.88) TaxID=685588 RepID=A0A067TH84_GALM3|nr:hypothetical protein GALMADRAFT_243203 [Galerina marginata CBS 339.88]